MMKVFPAPSPTSHLPRKRPRGGASGFAGLVSSATDAAAGNSTRTMSDRLKLCRWPSLKTITMLPEPFFAAGAAVAIAPENASRSIVDKPAATIFLCTGFSFFVQRRDGDFQPRHSGLRG